MRYQLAGIVHILAISGLHISILGMGLYNLLKCAGLGIWPAGIFSLAVMLQYGMMTGGSVSTMRAVTMFLIAMGARITGRIYDMPSAVSVTAMMILAESPAYLLDSGFLLSFGCVLGICVASERICALAGAKRKVTKAFWGSVALWLVTLPVMLKFFGEVSLAGLILNLAVLPSVGVVLSGGVAAMLLGFVSIPAARAVIFPAKGVLLLYEKLCELAGRSRWCTWIGGEPELWQILVYYMILIAVLFIGQHIKESDQKKKELEKGEAKGLQHILRIAAIVLLTLSILTLGVRSFGYLFKSETLKITCLDVGQGDGILVRTPDNKHYLIDGGSSDVSKVGTYRILPFLKYSGIRTVDGIFLSHPDNDHINGIEELFEAVAKKETSLKIETVYLSKNKEKEEKINEIAQLAKRAGCEVRYIKKGAQLKQKAFQVECLSPENETGESNENSQVLLFKTDNLSVLFTGDMEQKGEDAVTEQLNERQEQIDILKVPHHGSKNSAKEAFLEAAGAKIGIISCGEGNSYGHPHKELLERLKEKQIGWYVTIERGAITVTAGKINKLSFYKK